ncbi:MAG: hypothetical protein NZ927_09750 [Candidatus Calescibacterium sp.]|nr:hypothetical protein [Candidatus Calescibacterium sp.]
MKKFKDFLLPIVRERQGKEYIFYTFNIDGNEENGFVSPSIDAPTYLELEELLNHASLLVKPQGIRLGVSPPAKPRMCLYIKFEILKEFVKIFPGDYKPRLVEKDLEIYLPETYVFLKPSPRSVFWYYQPKRVLIRNYEVPCDTMISYFSLRN